METGNFDHCWREKGGEDKTEARKKRCGFCLLPEPTCRWGALWLVSKLTHSVWFWMQFWCFLMPVNAPHSLNINVSLLVSTKYANTIFIFVIIKWFCCPCASSLCQSSFLICFFMLLCFSCWVCCLHFPFYFLFCLFCCSSHAFLFLSYLCRWFFAQGFVFNCIFPSLFFLPLAWNCWDTSLCCPQW